MSRECKQARARQETRHAKAKSPLRGAGFELDCIIYCLNSGSPTWTRTRDLRINSPSLYRLSYQGIDIAIITSPQGLAQCTNPSVHCLARGLNSGSPTWTRTRDLRINSPSLYRLSYQGIDFNSSETACAELEEPRV